MTSRDWLETRSESGARLFVRLSQVMLVQAHLEAGGGSARLMDGTRLSLDAQGFRTLCELLGLPHA